MGSHDGGEASASSPSTACRLPTRTTLKARPASMLWATCAGSARLSRLWRRRFGRYLPDAGALSHLGEDVSANMVSHGERSPNRCCLAACGTSESKHSPCFRQRRCRCHYRGRHSLTLSDSASLDLRARAMTAARVPPGNDRRRGCEHDAGLLKAVCRRRRSRSRGREEASGCRRG